MAYGLLIALFFSLSTLSNTIPQSSIYDNAKESKEYFSQHDTYPEVLNVSYFTLDYFTDALMINIASSGDDEHILDTTLLNPYHSQSKGISEGLNTQNSSDIEHYSRYWHGYLLVLKPLLIFYSYNQIRIINAIFLLLVTCYCFYLIYIKVGKRIAVSFIISLLLIAFPIVPLTFQFSTCFYIAFIATIILLKFPQLTNTRDGSIIFFFIVGGATSYFDFLTTPQITLGFPLVAYLIKENRFNKVKELLVLGCIWALGYASIWVSKWLIAYILTGENVIMAAVEQAEYRTAGEYNTQCLNTPIKILSYIIPFITLFLLCIYKKYTIGKKAVKDNLYLLLLALFVPAWYLLLRNHSVVHYWFTWRAIVLTIFCILCFMSKTLNFNNHEQS